MPPVWIAFIVGLFIGSFLAFICACVCMTSRN